LNRRQHRPLIAQLLVIAILLASLPMAASPAITERKSGPAFTLDICHPLPTLEAGTGSCTLAALTADSYSVALEDRGPTEIADLAGIGRADEAPDPPPPETPA
jgi:hypothetical protein